MILLVAIIPNRLHTASTKMVDQRAAVCKSEHASLVGPPTAGGQTWGTTMGESMVAKVVYQDNSGLGVEAKTS